MEIEPQVNFDSTQVAFSYKSTRELRKANFIFSLVNNPFMSGLARSLASTSIALHLPVKGIIRPPFLTTFAEVRPYMKVSIPFLTWLGMMLVRFWIILQKVRKVKRDLIKQPLKYY